MPHMLALISPPITFDFAQIVWAGGLPGHILDKSPDFARSNDDLNSIALISAFPVTGLEILLMPHLEPLLVELSKVSLVLDSS